MKQQVSAKNLAKYAAACASSFDPDTTLHMVDGYNDGYMQAIRDVCEWLKKYNKDELPDHIKKDFKDEF